MSHFPLDDLGCASSSQNSWHGSGLVIDVGCLKGPQYHPFLIRQLYFLQAQNQPNPAYFPLDSRPPRKRALNYRGYFRLPTLTPHEGMQRTVRLKQGGKRMTCASHVADAESISIRLCFG